jgi:hypothetical protein
MVTTFLAVILAAAAYAAEPLPGYTSLGEEPPAAPAGEPATPAPPAASAEAEAPPPAAPETPPPAPTASEGETAAADGLPDWVLRDATGAFEVQVPSAETRESDPQPDPAPEAPPEPPVPDAPESPAPDPETQVSALEEGPAPASDGLPDWVIRGATAAFEVPAETETADARPAAPPKRATGHGDNRPRTAAAEAASSEPWPRRTTPGGDSRTDLSNAFLQAMARATPLPKRGRGLAGGDDADLAGRAAFERTLEERIDASLAVLLGPDLARSFVRAKVEPIPGSGELEMIDRAQEAVSLWDDIREKIEASPPVLPGYRLSRGLREEVLRRVADEAAPVRAPDRKRTVLTVTLLVDESVEETALTRASAAIADAVGLDADRGDMLQITRADIRPSWGRLLRGSRFRSAALTAACVALGAAIPIVVAFLLWKPRGKEWTPKRASAPLENETKTAAPADFDPAPFWNDSRYSHAVADFLARETAEASSAFLALLSPDAAGDVYRKLPEKQRRAVAAFLAAGSPSNPRELFQTAHLRRRLREHLASYARGPGLLEELLLRAPQHLRDGILGDIHRADPAAARRLRRAVPTFRELAKADASALRLLLSPFSTADLVLAFYEFDAAAREKMLESLPSILRDEVREELRAFVPDSTESVDAARARITARWRRLELDGRVTSFLTAAAE